MKILQLYTIIIGTGGQLLFYTQAYKIFATKSAQDLSLTAFIIALVSMSNWLFYGLKIKDLPLVVANIIGVIGAIIVITGILMYG